MRRFIFTIMLALCVGLFPTVTQGATQNYVVKVNKADLTGTANKPFVSGSVMYVPFNVIVQKMGDKVTWINSQKKSVIRKKDGTIISVKANDTTAVVNGKLVPMVTKKANGKTVDAKVKAVFKNNTLYIPLEFLASKNGVNYPVKKQNEDGKTVIYVGELPPTYTVQVNGVALKTTEGQAFQSGVTTYVPLNAIAQKMGDTVTWDKKKQTSVIKKKNKTTITAKANTTTATVNGKSVPFVTKTEKGKTVDAKVKSLYINNTLYVPVQFISNPKTLNYSVKTEKGKDKTVIYVGKLPASSQPTGKVYPDGWVAPVLKSSWTPNHAQNLKIFEKELGFSDGGTSWGFPGKQYAIIVFFASEKCRRLQRKIHRLAAYFLH